MSELLAENESETEHSEIHKICLINNSYDDIDDRKVLISTQKEKENIVEKYKNKDMLCCKQCKYKCKLEITLNKHMWDQHFKEKGAVQEDDKEIHKKSIYKEVEENVNKTVFVFGDSKQRWLNIMTLGLKNTGGKYLLQFASYISS